MDQEDPFARVGLGISLERAGRYRDARASYLIALKIDHNNVSALTSLATLYSKMGKQSSALRYARKAVDLDDASATTHGVLGRVLEEAGSMELALDQYKAASEIATADCGPLVSYAIALERTNRITEAVNILRQAASIEPHNFTVWATLGRLATQSKDQHLALEAAEALCKLKRHEGRGLLAAAHIYRCMNDFESAVSCSRKVLALNPLAHSAWNILLTHCWKVGPSDDFVHYLAEIPAGVRLSAVTRAAVATAVSKREDLERYVGWDRRSNYRTDRNSLVYRALQRFIRRPNERIHLFPMVPLFRPRDRTFDLLSTIESSLVDLDYTPGISLCDETLDIMRELALGRDAFLRKDFQSVPAFCEAAMTDRQFQAVAFQMTSSSQRRTGDHVAAYNTASRWTQSLPSDFLGWFVLGIRARKLWKFEESVKAFEIARKAGVDGAALELVSVLGEMGNTGAQLEILKSLYLWSPNDCKTVEAYGRALLKNAQVVPAVEVFDRLAELVPKTHKHRTVVGNLFREAGEFDKAIREFTEALRMDQNYGAAEFGMGLVMEQLGETEDAMAHFERARLADELFQSQKT